VEELLAQEMLNPEHGHKTVRQLLAEMSARTRETITVHQIARLEVPAKFTAVG
jgi:hypothetical protein